MHLSPQLATVVIGAGPAGLIFSLMNRIGLIQNNIPASVWPLLLLDKRTEYIRNHRLELDKTVFTQVQKDVSSTVFDEFIAFLSDNNFRPVVNELEEFLLGLLKPLGVDRTYGDVGNKQGQTSFSEIRAMLPPEFSPPTNLYWTIVGADSVKSTTRGLISRGGQITGTHEHLVRLKILGDHLPESIGVVENYRLSKVLASVLTYRLNKNGFGEMDLFLHPDEYLTISELNPNPKNPIEITKELLKQLKTPFFQQVILAFLEHTPGASIEKVLLQSSFKLEHAVSKVRVKHMKELNAIGFLVGDAAIALPFQRGMAALVQCAYQLSETHLAIYNELKLLKSDVNPFKLQLIADTYQVASKAIAKKEIKKVSSRAALVRGLRQFIRISAMLPFPIQSWLLGHEQVSKTIKTPRASLFINIVIALSASGFLSIAFLLETGLFIGLMEFTQLLLTAGGFIVLSLFTHFVGGIVYRASITFHGQSHIWLKRIWQFQILLWILLGLGHALYLSALAGSFVMSIFGIQWWLGGIAFLFGLILFDWLGTRWFKHSGLNLQSSEASK